jgi:hypothetical protein
MHSTQTYPEVLRAAVLDTGGGVTRGEESFLSKVGG